MLRCPSCPHDIGGNKPVPPCGPERADILIIGESPGHEENKKGIPFIGKTGQELNDHYLPLAGLTRQQVRITNCVACLPPGDGKLDPKQPKNQEIIRSCSQFHLLPEIARCNPKLIIPMGGVANSIIPNIDLDMHWGMPLIWDIPDLGEYNIFPSYHPALGIHEPKKMGVLRRAFIRLRKHLRGELHVPTDQYPNPDYAVVTTPEELDQYIRMESNHLGIGENLDIALDTEVTRDHEPFCTTLSVWPGTARLIRVTSKLTLDRLDYWLAKWMGHILLHNRLFDRPILARMGVHVPHKRIVDTMMEAYHLGNLPQGLKVLSYRHLGMEMQSFDDLVTPHSTARVLSYYASALQHQWPRAEEEMVRDKEGQWKLYKPQSLNTKLKRMFTDLGKNTELDVFERWWGWEGDHKQVEKKLGRWPGRCITHVPFNMVIEYACRDSDATLRLWPILKQASHLVRKRSEDQWAT